MGNCQGKGVDGNAMIADGMVNMEKAPGSDIDENHEPGSTNNKDGAMQEEEKDADAFDDDYQPQDMEDLEPLEETDQKEVDAPVNDKPITDPEPDTVDAPVAVITESVKNMDLQNDESKQTEPEEASKIDAMETEYQPQDIDEPESKVEEPEVQQTEEALPEPVVEEPCEPEAEAVEETEPQPEIEESVDAAQQPTAAIIEEPMQDTDEVADDAVDVDDTADEPQPDEEELNENVVDDEKVEKVTDGVATEDVPMADTVEEAKEEPLPVQEDNVEKVGDSVDAEPTADMGVQEDAVPEQETAEPMESPEAVNAEQHQSAPVETDTEHGVEDDEFIIKTVMSFVEVNPEEIEMRFDANTHGGNLQFVGGRTVCKVEDDAPSICAFGQPISADTHQQCDIQIQWKESASEEGGFYMGYLTKPKDAIRYWNAELGSILCLDSVGYYVYGGCGYFRELREGNCHEIGYRAPNNLKAGDTMRMIVDFAKDTLTLRHNGKMAAICPLYGHKEITLAFSFGPKGDEVEVLSCELK